MPKAKFEPFSPENCGTINNFYSKVNNILFGTLDLILFLMMMMIRLKIGAYRSSYPIWSWEYLHMLLLLLPLPPLLLRKPIRKIGQTCCKWLTDICSSKTFSKIPLSTLSKCLNRGCGGRGGHNNNLSLTMVLRLVMEHISIKRWTTGSVPWSIRFITDAYTHEGKAFIFMLTFLVGWACCSSPSTKVLHD